MGMDTGIVLVDQMMKTLDEADIQTCVLNNYTLDNQQRKKKRILCHNQSTFHHQHQSAEIRTV